MAPANELTFVQKRFLVQRLACFETPSRAADAFNEEFGFEVARNRVAFYDPTTKAGAALAADLKGLFAETRKAFLADLESIPIANLAVRLRRLDRMAILAEQQGNFAQAADFGERAAKDLGGANTNRLKHELMGKDGKDLPAAAPAQVTIIRLPDNGRA